jgi:radical SAM protein with 4Fe4S-binding SPASM domain
MSRAIVASFAEGSDLVTHMQIPADDAALEVILKISGETCNLNCYYCYEKRKPYSNAKYLAPETLQRFLVRCGQRPLHIQLHGGEPLLVGLERMEALLSVMARHSAPISLAIQTNGTLLDEKWLNLFDRLAPQIDIGISLDGDEAHNAYRLDYLDRGSGGDVERALRLLAEKGRRVGVIAVVNRLLMGGIEGALDYFASFGSIVAVNLSPCFDFNVKIKRIPRGNLGLRALSDQALNDPALGDDDAKMPAWAITPDEYALCVTQAYDHWRGSGLFRRFSLEPAMSVIRRLSGQLPDSCHFNHQKCSFVLTLYPDGSIGSCDELARNEAHLGMIEDFASISDAVGYRTNVSLPSRFDTLLAKCEACSYHETCGGGCLATRLRYAATEYDEAYCGHRKSIIDHIASSITIRHVSTITE